MMARRGLPLVVVYGASGTLGQALVRRLVKAGELAIALAGRDGAPLLTLHAELARAGVAVQLRVAARDDAAALAALCDGALVVVDASSARMVADQIDPLVSAAIRAGAHYLDARRDPAAARALYERHDRAARHAAVVVCGSVGVEATLCDIAASLAASALGCGVVARGQAGAGVADEPTPLDQLDVTIAYDDYVASPGDARSFGEVGSTTGFRWERGRWHPSALGDRRRSLWLGGASRPALAWPGPEVISLPRHIAADRIDSYRALAADGFGSGLANMLARAAGPQARLGLGGRGGVLDHMVIAPVGDAAARARVRFAVCAEASAGGARAATYLTGRDPTSTTAAILAAACRHLAGHPSPGAGALASPEWWPAETALATLTADGVIEAGAGAIAPTTGGPGTGGLLEPPV